MPYLLLGRLGYVSLLNLPFRLLIPFLATAINVRVELEASDFSHSTLDCEYFDKYFEQVEEIREGLTFTRESCCFDCFLPTKICRGAFQKGEGVCLALRLIGTFIILSRQYYDHFANFQLFEKFIEQGLTLELTPAAYFQKFLAWEWSDIDTEMV